MGTEHVNWIPMKLSCALEKEFEPFLFQMWETFFGKKWVDISIHDNPICLSWYRYHWKYWLQDYIDSACLTNKIMLQNLMLQLTDVRIWQVKNLSDKEYEKSCNHVFHWGYEN